MDLMLTRVQLVQKPLGIHRTTGTGNGNKYFQDASEYDPGPPLGQARNSNRTREFAQVEKTPLRRHLIDSFPFNHVRSFRISASRRDASGKPEWID